MDAGELIEKMVSEDAAYKRTPSETLFRLGSGSCSKCKIEIVRGIDKEDTAGIRAETTEREGGRGKEGIKLSQQIKKKHEDKCGWFSYYGLNSWLLCCQCAHAEGWDCFEQGACRFCKTRALHKAPPKKPTPSEYAALERLRWWASSETAHQERLAQSRRAVKEEERRMQGHTDEDLDMQAQRRQVVHQFNLQKELWQ